jgi:uncharacterized protein YgiM (DUF1202 family)
MQKDKVRRLLGGVAAIGVAVAIAGCARNTAQNQAPANAYPPPPAASTQPAPNYGSTAQPNANNPGTNYATTSPLHLRSGPGVNNPVIGTLPSGTQVQATGSQQGGWWEVQSPDGTGWVSSRYLSPS